MELEADSPLISSCLRKIEDRLGWGDSNEWSTQDFESLSRKIQEATGVALSVATLKRIWGKVRYESKPTITTLNALAQYLGHENWLVFKQKHSGRSANGNGQSHPVKVDTHRPRKNKAKIILIGAAIASVGLIVYYFFPGPKGETSLNPGDFKFSSKKVVDEGVPNSVIFDYDASAAGEEDSVYIQQSWDKRLSTRVERSQRQHTSIYYHPGFFEAKLRINQTVVKEHNLFIKTKGWTSLVDMKPVPVYFEAEDVISNGRLGISVEQLTNNHIQLQPSPPYVAYYNMQDFDNAMSDDLIIETTFKNSYAAGANICQHSELRIQFAGGALLVPFSAKGCVSDLKFMNLDGKKTDLSSLGCDFREWVNFKLTIGKSSFTVHVAGNDPATFPINFKAVKFVGLGFTFQGTGEIDHVKVSNHDGNIYFEDNF